MQRSSPNLTRFRMRYKIRYLTVSQLDSWWIGTNLLGGGVARSVLLGGGIESERRD